MKKSFFSFLFLMLGTVSSYAATYYVRPGGSGNGSDWNNAMSLPASLQRGSTYILATGNYGSYNFDDLENGTEWIKIIKATEGNSGSVAGWDNNAMGIGQAVFNTLSFWRDYYEINGQRRNPSQWDEASSYGIKITHLQSSADNFPPGADYITVKYAAVGGSVQNSDDNVDYQDDGFRIDGGNGTKELHHYVYSQNYSSKVGPTHMYLNHVHDFLIEENFFHENYGKEAIQGIYQAYNIIVRNNMFVDTCQPAVSNGESTQGATAEVAGWAHSQGNWDNWQVYGNIFTKRNFKDSAHTDGVILGGSRVENITVNNWEVYNNVISNMDRRSGGGMVISIDLPGNNNRVYNNIWTDMGPQMSIKCVASDCSNNWCYNASGASCSNIGSNAVTGSANPFDTSSSDFRLKFKLNGATNARNTGKTLPKGDFDPLNPTKPSSGFDDKDGLGAVRGNGGWDMGAFEFGGTPPSNLHPADANSDFLMTLNEATAFGACWKTNCAVNATLENAVRAGTLWNASATGQYQYNPSNACPLCWEVKP